MRIETTRFGPIEIAEDRFLVLGEGLLGFPSLNRFLLIGDEGTAPFQWLQSVDEPSLAFVVIDPRWLLPDYLSDLPAALAERIGIRRPEEMGLLALVSIPEEDPQEMTANLKGPLVFNLATRRGVQLVLDDERYALRHPVIPVTA